MNLEHDKMCHLFEEDLKELIKLQKFFQPGLKTMQLEGSQQDDATIHTAYVTINFCTKRFLKGLSSLKKTFQAKFFFSFIIFF